MKKNLLFVFLMLFLIFQLPVNTYAIDASSVIGKRVQVGDNCYAYVEDLGNRKYTLHLDGYGNLYEKSTLSEEAKMIINFGSSKVIISNGISKIPDRFFSALGLNIIENHSSTLQIGSFNFIFGSSQQVEYYSLPQDFNLADNVYQVTNCPESFTTFVDIREKKQINFEYTMYFSDVAKSVIVRDGNKAITNYMFTRCPNLSECTIPASVTYIDPKAFADKNKITIRGYSGSYAEKYAKKNKIKFVSIGTTINQNKVYKVGAYNYKFNLSNNTATLVSSASKNIKKVTVPNKVTYAGKTFTVTNIAKNAFKNCTKLTKATIGSNVTQIGASAFYKCKKLQTIKIGTTKLTKIGSKAFNTQSSKLTLKIPKSKSTYKKLITKSKISKTVKFKLF